MQHPYNHDSFSKILRPSTALQSRLFLKKYQELSMQVKKVNNHSIPLTHTERHITNLSVKHSFTLYPSLSPYRQIELWTEEQINPIWAVTLAARGLEELFFQLCCCVSF